MLMVDLHKMLNIYVLLRTCEVEQVVLNVSIALHKGQGGAAPQKVSSSFFKDEASLKELPGFIFLRLL